MIFSGLVIVTVGIIGIMMAIQFTNYFLWGCGVILLFVGFVVASNEGGGRE